MDDPWKIDRTRRELLVVLPDLVGHRRDIVARVCKHRNQAVSQKPPWKSSCGEGQGKCLAI